MSSDNTETSQPMSLSLAFTPIVVLVGLLSWNVFVFGNDALSGSSQFIIVIATAFASAIGLVRGVSWQKQQKAVVSLISAASPPILILMLVGALASTWLLSGTVPSLVYYGLKLLNPSIFLVACCIACAITSIVSGSSWSTAATIGVAMVGIGRALNIPDGLIGGAIISGAYFGDKMSPLSDTTNLASGVSGVPLFAHIRYLAITSGPSFLVALLIFTVIGLTIDTGTTNMETQQVMETIESRFSVGVLTMFPALLTLGLIIAKVDAIPSLFIGLVSGLVGALAFQQDLLADITSSYNEHALYTVLMKTSYEGISIETSNSMLTELFSSSGMKGMLGTIWLIIVAMSFGGVISACGMVARIVQSFAAVSKSLLGLTAATSATCLVTNVSTSDQYISVTIPGRMLSEVYDRAGFDRRNLSRTLEDSGTVTSVLIPWNTCGAYHASVLGISTLTYLPFCFFNLLSPIMTLLFTAFKIKLAQKGS